MQVVEGPQDRQAQQQLWEEAGVPRVSAGDEGAQGADQTLLKLLHRPNVRDSRTVWREAATSTTLRIAAFNYEGRSLRMSSFPEVFSTTIHLINFTLGGCIAEDPRKRSVQWEVVWISASQESTSCTPYFIDKQHSQLYIHWVSCVSYLQIEGLRP